LFENVGFNAKLLKQAGIKFLHGVNENYVLAKKFIIAASYILKRVWVLLITIVDSDFYNNMFHFNELAEKLGIS
jgi:hypothetical protein